MDRVGRGSVNHFGFLLKPGVDLDTAITEVVAAGGHLVERSRGRISAMRALSRLGPASGIWD